MDVVRRPAARVLCLDGLRRLLLLKWRDPADRSIVWEPPGGGLEPGERTIDAARREIEEETGLPGDAVLDRHVMVERDVDWTGRHYGGQEAFFLARIDRPGPLRRDNLEEWETQCLCAQEWFSWGEVLGLRDKVEPPQLAELLTALDPDGPWSSDAR